MASQPDILKLLTDWLAANTSLEVNTNLFARYLSDDQPDRAVLLRSPGGSAQDIQQRIWEDYSLQCIVRATDTYTAEMDSMIVYEFWHYNKKSLTLLPDAISPEIKVYQNWAIQSPYALPADSRRRALYTTNYFFKINKP